MKKQVPPPPELLPWQVEALEAVAGSSLASEVVFGGGSALSAVHLHHRFSEDLDFFLQREVDALDLRPIVEVLAGQGWTLDIRTLRPLVSLVLSRSGQEAGKIGFAHYPFEPIEPPSRWRGLAAESMLDTAVNKVQAVLTRFQPRDFVDLFFLLSAGRDDIRLDRLLDLVRAKFDVGAHRLGLAERLLLVRDITQLPRLLRPLTLDAMTRFFEEEARNLVREDRARGDDP
ncbi:MAG: nucleotidyl transferase AbiEii/AbiGii toxin family protein [Planctomycetes bacterium]|nr:nucleotidyl transferase AbiEii/AbiGii toxin family protein [Planctomycetota bacterium]